MNVGILGTGTVGATIGSRLLELGHSVRMGGRLPTNEKGQAWASRHDARASAGSFADAAAFGEIVFNCTKGAASLDVVGAAGEANLAEKVLVDLANPLDESRARVGPLLYCNTDSLGERIQAAVPSARVVKALNTMWCGLMVNPRMLPEAHTALICGNDANAKHRVEELLRSFGWRPDEIIDLGDLSAARAMEMYLPLWLRINGVTNTSAFNVKVVRG